MSDKHPKSSKSPSAGTPAHSDPPPDSNPKYLAILSPGIHREPDGDDYMAPSEIDCVCKEIPGAFVSYISNDVPDGETAAKEMLKRIKEHIMKYGPLDQLQIGSHGGPQIIGLGDEDIWKKDGRTIDLKKFLEDLERLQKDIQADPEYKRKYGDAKIAKRIVFMGCDLFTDLDPKDVEYYRLKAKSLGIDIIGNRSTETDTRDGPKARRVIFDHNGNVGIDRTDTPGYKDTGDDHSGAWLNNYLPPTQLPKVPQPQGAQARTPPAPSP